MSTLPAPEAPSPAAGPTVVVRTVPLEPTDPLLTYCPPADPTTLSWVRRGEGLVGWGAALTFESRGRDRFARGRGVVAGDRQPCRRARRGRAAGHRARLLRLLPLRRRLRRARPARRAVDDRRSPRRADVADHDVARPAADLPRGPYCCNAIPSRPGASPSPTAPSPRPTTRMRCAEAVRRIGAGEVDKVVLARDLVATRSPRPSTRAGCCGASPSATRTPGSSRWPVSSARRPSCSSAATRASSPRGCSPARSAAPATTPRTSRSPPRSPARPRTSRSTSMPCAPSPTPSRRTRSSMNVPEAPFVLHLPNVMHLATDVAAVERRRRLRR